MEALMQTNEGARQDGLALIRISPLSDAAVKLLADEAVKLREYHEKRCIATEDDAKAATDDLGSLKALLKRIEEKRKEYVQPIKEHLKAVDEVFKKITEPLNQAEAATRHKILGFRRVMEERAAEVKRINDMRVEAAQREAALNGGEISEDINLVPEPPAPGKSINGEVAKAGTAKVWKFEVEDISKLPETYKTPDYLKIGKAVRAGVEIPGVKAWQEDTLRVSSRGFGG
jgi:hypothetical protein